MRTKLYRPEAPADLVAREDLLARLEAGRRLPLTLVSAPAGYGKSTLVSHWLETSEVASTWLSLDPAESPSSGFRTPPSNRRRRPARRPSGSVP